MIAELGAGQAVAAIRNGELKAEDYVGVLLRRAEALKALNACVSVNADEALQAARAVDQARASGQPLPPLAGLPLLVKDNEERFLLGGAAHERCHERTGLGAAPVSKKRIGLNLAAIPPMGFASPSPLI